MTVLSRTSPRVAHDIMKTKILADANKTIGSKPAEIFAQQGLGTRVATRRRGFFSDEVETIIEPIPSFR